MYIKCFFVQYKLSLLPFNNAAPCLTSPFVLIYNCVVSGSPQQHIFNYFRIRFFVVCLDCVHKQLYTAIAFHFFHHCDISFVMSQLRYQYFCYNNVFNVIFWYVQVTHKSYVIITLFLGMSLWDILYYVTSTFFQILKKCILNNIRNGLFTGAF